MPSFNQLMETLPLDLSERIYRQAHVLLIKSIPTGYFYHNVDASLKSNAALRSVGPYRKWRTFKRSFENCRDLISSDSTSLVHIDRCYRIVLANQHFQHRIEYKRLVEHIHHVIRSTTIQIRQAAAIEKLLKI